MGDILPQIRVAAAQDGTSKATAAPRSQSHESTSAVIARAKSPELPEGRVRQQILCLLAQLTTWRMCRQADPLTQHVLYLAQASCSRISPKTSPMLVGKGTVEKEGVTRKPSILCHTYVSRTEILVCKKPMSDGWKGDPQAHKYTRSAIPEDALASIIRGGIPSDRAQYINCIKPHVYRAASSG